MEHLFYHPKAHRLALFPREMIYENFIYSTNDVNTAKFCTLLFYFTLFFEEKKTFLASFPSMLLLCDREMNNSLKNLFALLDYVCQLPSVFVCKSLTLHCDVQATRSTYYFHHIINRVCVYLSLSSHCCSYLPRKTFFFMTTEGRFIIV